MRKSERYILAMCAVIDDPDMLPTTKIEVLETLMADKRLAEFAEEAAEKEAGKNAVLP